MRYSFIIISLVIFTSKAFALPKFGVTSLISPQRNYELRLVDALNPGTYQLLIFRNGIELAQYPFLGELVSAYWSPSQKFVAINNHYGHDGTYVWVMSLDEGSVVTSHGTIKTGNYDRYTDYQYFTNLVDRADSKLKKTYPDADNDRLRDGYSSVAYRWERDNQLLMFHEFGFDNLYTRSHLIIQAFTTWHVSDRAVGLKSIRFRKAKGDQHEPMPMEVKRTLNFIP